MLAKVCFKCSIQKPMDAFYKHPKMADGHLGKCKDCTRADVAENRSARKEQYSQYDRKRSKRPDRLSARLEYQRTDAFKQSHAEASAKWDAQNRSKKRAHTAVNRAIRNGILTRHPCQVCGSSDSHGHHPDYSRPLDVVWLCPEHHAQLHEEHREHVRLLCEKATYHSAANILL